MTFLVWFRRTFYGPPPPSVPLPEKDVIVGQIANETLRLDKAIANLEKEVSTIKRSRVEMGRILDDALQAMQKEFRK